MKSSRLSRVLVTGATGFIGRALVPALLDAGHFVRATTRDLSRATGDKRIEWVQANLDAPDDVEAALTGMDAAYYLVHGMGGGHSDYREADRRSAQMFVAAAARTGLKRIIYLGGVAPKAEASEHLASRLEVGEILRNGQAPALELRASLIIGQGSASWQIIRDLALRLPAMVLPKWTESKTAPVALDDVVVALVRGLDIELPHSRWYDIPGPEVLSGKEMLGGIAALKGRTIPALKIPLLTPSLSSWWLKLVTRVDFSLARELVQGFTGDLLAVDDAYWKLISHQPEQTFNEAARAALAAEPAPESLRERAGSMEEAVVQKISGLI